MTRHKPSCVVLGGGGFIGMKVYAVDLLASGFRVRAFGRHCAFTDELAGVEWYQGDFADAGALTAAIETFQVVFHLIHATTPQSANLDMPSDVERNVLPSIAMLDICRKLGVRRVILRVFGRDDLRVSIRNSHARDRTDRIRSRHTGSAARDRKYPPASIASLRSRISRAARGQSLRSAANGAQEPGRSSPLWSRARYGGNRSRFGGMGPSSAISFSSTTSSTRWRRFVDDQATSSIFNIGSSQGRSLRDVIEAIEGILGRKVDLIWKPKRLD